VDYGGSSYSDTITTSVQYANKIASGNTVSLSGENTIPANAYGWLYLTFNVGNKAVATGDTVSIRIMLEGSGTQTIYTTAQSCT